MSEEELKAIQELKEFISPDTEIKAISMGDIKIIYNLIEKQQKEIEELEKDNIELRKYYATRKEVEDLKDTINCLYESSKEYINKDKIRDKIKELEELWEQYNDEYYSEGMDMCEYKIELLKELINDKSKNVWVD